MVAPCSSSNPPRVGHHRGVLRGDEFDCLNPAKAAEEPAGAVGGAAGVSSLGVIPGEPGGGDLGERLLVRSAPATQQQRGGSEGEPGCGLGNSRDFD